MKYSMTVGYDQRMPVPFGVAVRSMIKTVEKPHLLNINMLHLPALHAMGAYYRPTRKTENGGLWDEISDAPMSTEFAISRFLVPMLSAFNGWAGFCDSDFLFRSDIGKAFRNLDPKYAVYCVKHKYQAAEGTKMDGQVQTNYARKNWSSFMIFNCAHKSNKYLTVENVNKDTGRDLHRFHWLRDDEIGELNESWNWLEGHSTMEINPDAVHFTRGTPDMVGYENVPYADEYRELVKELPLCKLGS